MRVGKRLCGDGTFSWKALRGGFHRGEYRKYLFLSLITLKGFGWNYYQLKKSKMVSKSIDYGFEL